MRINTKSTKSTKSISQTTQSLSSLTDSSKSSGSFDSSLPSKSVKSTKIGIAHSDKLSNPHEQIDNIQKIISKDGYFKNPKKDSEKMKSLFAQIEKLCSSNPAVKHVMSGLRILISELERDNGLILTYEKYKAHGGKQTASLTEKISFLRNQFNLLLNVMISVSVNAVAVDQFIKGQEDAVKERVILKEIHSILSQHYSGVLPWELAYTQTDSKTQLPTTLYAQPTQTLSSKQLSEWERILIKEGYSVARVKGTLHVNLTNGKSSVSQKLGDLVKESQAILAALKERTGLIWSYSKGKFVLDCEKEIFSQYSFLLKKLAGKLSISRDDTDPKKITLILKGVTLDDVNVFPKFIKVDEAAQKYKLILQGTSPKELWMADLPPGLGGIPEAVPLEEAAKKLNVNWDETIWFSSQVEEKLKKPNCYTRTSSISHAELLNFQKQANYIRDNYLAFCKQEEGLNYGVFNRSDKEIPPGHCIALIAGTTDIIDKDSEKDDYSWGLELNDEIRKGITVTPQNTAAFLQQGFDLKSSMPETQNAEIKLQPDSFVFIEELDIPAELKDQIGINNTTCVRMDFEGRPLFGIFSKTVIKPKEELFINYTRRYWKGRNDFPRACNKYGAVIPHRDSKPREIEILFSIPSDGMSYIEKVERASLESVIKPYVVYSTTLKSSLVIFPEHIKKELADSPRAFRITPKIFKCLGDYIFFDRPELTLGAWNYNAKTECLWYTAETANEVETLFEKLQSNGFKVEMAATNVLTYVRPMIVIHETVDKQLQNKLQQVLLAEQYSAVLPLFQKATTVPVHDLIQSSSLYTTGTDSGQKSTSAETAPTQTKTLSDKEILISLDESYNV